MNTYKITFSRENGSTGSDNFTAATEAQARRDFREVYRHGSGEILSVTLISIDSPATEQQERDALAKIRKLVEQLGPGSYLATTFEGCFDLAEENINNDWGCSMADRARRADARASKAEETAKELHTQITQLKDQLAESEKDYQAAHETAHAIAAQKDEEIARLTAQLEQLKKDEAADTEANFQLISRAGEAQRRAEAAEAEVIRLKAKLYDFMVGGAQV